MSILAEVALFLCGAAGSLIGNAMYLSWRIGKYEERITAYGCEIDALKDEKEIIMGQLVQVRLQLAALTGKVNGGDYRHKGGC